MTARPISLMAACALLAAVAPSGSARASGMGGGGGGGGQMPSMTVPDYDPVQSYQQGMAAYQAGKFKDAAGDFQHVTDAQPSNANSWYMLGMARSSAGDIKGGQHALEKSIKLDATAVAPHRELALVDVKLNQPDKANAQLAVLKDRATSCGDTCPESAEIKAAVASVEQALGVVHPSASTIPPPDNMRFAGLAGGDMAYVRAVSLINERRFTEALASLGQAEAVFGPHPDILTYQGYVWRKLGRLDQAEAYYKAALAIAPAHRGATEYYGELKVIRGDLPGARVMLARLENQCAFGCAESEDLRRWIERGGDPAS